MEEIYEMLDDANIYSRETTVVIEEEYLMKLECGELLEEEDLDQLLTTLLVDCSRLKSRAARKTLRRVFSHLKQQPKGGIWISNQFIPALLDRINVPLAKGRAANVSDTLEMQFVFWDWLYTCLCLSFTDIDQVKLTAAFDAVSTLLDSLSHTRRSMYDSVQHHFSVLLAIYNDLPEKLLSYAFTQETSKGHMALVSAIVNSCATSSFLNNYMPQLMKFYAVHFFGDRILLPPHPSFLSAFNTILSLADAGIIEKEFASFIEKGLRRHPESVLPICRVILPQTRIHLNAIAIESIVKPLLLILKGSSHENSANALVILSAISTNLSHQNALQCVREMTTEITKISLWEHRQLYVMAMKALIPSNEDSLTLTLISIASKETHDSVLYSMMDLLATWLPESNPEVMQFIKTGFTQEKKRNAYLYLIYRLDQQTVTESVSSDLIAILEKSLTSPSIEGWEAFCLISNNTDKYRPLLTRATDTKSMLFNEKFISKCFLPQDTREAEIFMKTAEKILGSPSLSSIASLPCQFAILKGIFHLMHDDRWSLAHTCVSMYRTLLGKTEGLFDKSIRAMTLLLDEWTERHQGPKRPFVRCLWSLVMNANVTQDHLAQLIVFAHHPYFTNSQHQWRLLCENVKRRQSLDFSLDSIVEHQLDAMLTIIFGEYGLKNKSTKTQIAAMNAMKTLSQIHPEHVMPTMMSTILMTLSDTRFHEISETDMLIFHCPEDTLAISPTPTTGKTNNGTQAKKSDGRTAMTDADWEQQLRNDLAKKKGDSVPSKEEQSRVQTQLAMEQARRQQMRSFLQQAEQSFCIISNLANANPEAMHRFIYDVLFVILPLAKNPLLGNTMLKIYMSLGKCLFPLHLVHILRCVPILYFRWINPSVVGTEWLEEPLNDMTKRILNALERHRLNDSESLPTSTFSFIFPVLSHLAYDRHAEKHDAACAMILTHCKERLAADEAPCDELIALLIFMMSNYTKYQMAASEALLALCTAMDDIDAITVENIRVFLEQLAHSDANVRKSALEVLSVVSCPEEIELTYQRWLFLTIYDVDQSVGDMARLVWEKEEKEAMDDDISTFLTECLKHPMKHLRMSAGKALAATMERKPMQMRRSLQMAFDVYCESHREGAPIFDDFNRLVHSTKKDVVETREAVALYLTATATITLKTEDVETYLLLVFDFLTVNGLRDRSSHVRSMMMEAGQAILLQHGLNHVQLLLPLFDQLLSSNVTSPSASTTANKILADQQREADDAMRQAVIVLTGAAARFLDPHDEKVKKILSSLLMNRQTPSEDVQIALGECIAPLVKALSTEEVKVVVDELLKSLLSTGGKYAERRGAAYTLAGVVKGKGIAALKDFSLMLQLKSAIENKEILQRESALFTYGALSLFLGRLFEPYILQILPLLLAAFSDSAADVREAAGEAAKVMMARLSGHCVKLILPTLLQGLGTEQPWRTQLGSVEMLGAMSHCAPAQLSQCLPTIVPRLSEILLDAHIKVQSAGKEALQAIGGVIKNAEVRTLVPILLDALCDPKPSSQETALKVLLGTEFVHFIDAPSLALMLPILQRALKERSTETKKRAAQIIGNMCSLTDPKDLTFYVPSLLPGVQEILLDPVPEVRTIAAKALGTLVKKLGESHFSELLPWLMKTLCADTTSVDRAGAAQGLAEVLAALGEVRIRQVLPELLSMAVASHARPSVREGAMSALMYLPSAFGEQDNEGDNSSFQPFLASMVPAILSGLADDNDGVREVAMRAGQRMIHQYATTPSAIDILLPSLQQGVFEGNWRIRQTSLQLIGVLLYRLTGMRNSTMSEMVSVMMAMDESQSAEDMENGDMDDPLVVLQRTLGIERCHTMLATLYLARQDVNALVRQTALQVWKSIIQNTPRTIKEILPGLIPLLVNLLASPMEDCQLVAARTLGEIVKKLGERLVTELLPLMQERLQNEDASTRRGVCIALAEIIGATARHQLAMFVNALSSVFRVALCDVDDDVRSAAAHAFDLFHRQVGDKVIDSVVPFLLNDMTSNEHALMALKEIMVLKSRDILPIVLTSICQQSGKMNAQALLVLLPVADGHALLKHADMVIGGFSEWFITDHHDISTICHDAMMAFLQVIAEDSSDLIHLLGTLRSHLSADEFVIQHQRCALYLLHLICPLLSEKEKIGLFDTIVPWMTNGDMMNLAIMALESLIKSVKKENQPSLIVPLRRSLRIIKDKPNDALQTAKGVGAILPVYLHALMLGDALQREMAALGICDLLQDSSDTALRSFAVQLAGPLIRVMGDRFPWQVKSAILRALFMLLKKLGAALKPFLPQLQTIFVKSLQDPQLNVRLYAAEALGQLVLLQPRIDPLLNDLINQVKDGEMKETALQAILHVVNHAGSNISEVGLNSLRDFLFSDANTDNEDELTAALLARMIPLHHSDPMVAMNDYMEKSKRKPFHLTMIAYLFYLTPNILSIEKDSLKQIADVVFDCMRNGVVANKEMALIVSEKLMPMLTSLQQDELLVLNVKCLGVENSIEIRRLLLMILYRLACNEETRTILLRNIAIIMPLLMLNVKERVMPIKLAAERVLAVLLKVNNQDLSNVKEICEKLDVSLGKSVYEYATRVLSRVATKDNADTMDSKEGGHAVEEELPLRYVVLKPDTIVERDPLDDNL